MTAGQWRVTALLVVLALAFAIFLSLHFGHAAVLVTAAFTAGAVNGVLDNLDTDRLPTLGAAARSRGLAEVQALEFSLSGFRTGAGARAVNQLADIGTAALESRQVDPRSVEGPLGEVLSARRGTSTPSEVNPKMFDAAMDQLERLLRARPDPLPRHRHPDKPAKDSS